ncbi:MAG: hypothetical protein E7143_06015 [Rikenellaceae bacterium]|nr:hypothetical protein [Rikenellaceae bacterium]
MEYSENVKFIPWVGPEYEYGIRGFDNNGHIIYGTKENPGIKVAVLGDSHYCANQSEAVKTITNTVIKDLLQKESEFEQYKNTYTKFIKSFTGYIDEFTNDSKIEAWQHILFYNYVQEAMERPRQSPSEKQFSEAQIPFFEILEKNSPDVIIVWGKRLYNNLPQCGKQYPDLDLTPDLGNGCSMEIWAYEVKGKWIPIIAINHPSGAYSYKKWATAIRCFIIKFLENEGK